MELLPLFSQALGWKWCPRVSCSSPLLLHPIFTLVQSLSPILMVSSVPCVQMMFLLITKPCWHLWQMGTGSCSFAFLIHGIQKGWAVWAEVALITIITVLSTKRMTLCEVAKQAKVGLVLLSLFMPPSSVVVQSLSCVWLFCDLIDCSMPGFPVLHYLPEFAQVHVHWVSDAIQISHPLFPPFSCLQSFQHQGLFQRVGIFCIGWPKHWSFSFDGSGLVVKLCPTLETPWTVAHWAPLSVEFSRQEYWSGLPFPSPGDLLDPGIEPRFPALQADSLPSELPSVFPMNIQGWFPLR